MTREERIVETFVELADTMVDNFDVIEFMHRLVERSMELMDCAEVGLLLANAAGSLQVMASSGERSEALELLQSRTEEGPCLECYRDSRLVFSEDLAADTGRWPTFAPAAVQNGIKSVHAIPMRVHSRTMARSTCFVPRPAGFPSATCRSGREWRTSPPWPSSRSARCARRAASCNSSRAP